jgi:uncharacterized membrane protein YeaQ/YmgE (transglycosylase-associated protein family)
MEGLVLWWVENSWLLIGSVSGSLVAMISARNLRLWGRLQTLTVGSITGCVAGPAICEIWFKAYDPETSSIPSFVCAFVGLVALGVIPTVMRKTKEWIARYQFKIVHSESPDE